MSASSAEPRDRDSTRAWPLWAALALLWILVAALVVAARARTDGRLVYPLDDAYIHMAMARHLALNGVWGVTPYGFSSSSSSPLWTLLLAALDRVLGVHDATPLALNLVFASLALMVAHRALRNRLSPVRESIALIALVVLVPLPVVVWCGMEHSLQILLVLGFCFGALAELARPRPDASRGAIGLVALAVLMPMARYEGLFAIAVLGALLAWRGRRGLAIAVVVAALVPVAIYAAISIAHGWLAVPNSIVLKGAVTPGALPLAIPRQLRQATALAAVLGVAVLAWIRALRSDPAGRDAWALGAFLLVAALHLQLARVGWLHRYEAYLIALGVIVIAPPLLSAAVAATPAWRAVQALAALLALGLAWKRVGVLEQSVIASQNVHQQQYQMGRFLAAAYPGAGVAANDIGAIDYLADIRCCDLLGLANMETARLHRPGHRTTSDEIARAVERCDARIAVIYSEWFASGDIAVGGVPRAWGEPVGRWMIPDNVICAGDTVVFYALRPGERATLQRNLARFATMLPAGVRQE